MRDVVLLSYCHAQYARDLSVHHTAGASFWRGWAQGRADRMQLLQRLDLLVRLFGCWQWSFRSQKWTASIVVHVASYSIEILAIVYVCVA